MTERGDGPHPFFLPTNPAGEPPNLLTDSVFLRWSKYNVPRRFTVKTQNLLRFVT
jgi:hypothetical protein